VAVQIHYQEVSNRMSRDIDALEDKILSQTALHPNGIAFDTLFNELRSEGSTATMNQFRLALWRLIDQGSLELTVGRLIRIPLYANGIVDNHMIVSAG
jgi:hypothetical protein